MMKLTYKRNKQPLNAKPQKQEFGNRKGGTVYMFKPARERPSVYKRPVQMPPMRNNKTSIAYRHMPPVAKTGTSIAYKHMAPAARPRTSLAYKHEKPQSARDIAGRLVPKKPVLAPVTAGDLELRRKQMMARMEPPRPKVSELVARARKLDARGKAVSGTLYPGGHGEKKVEGQLIAKAVSATFTPAEPKAYLPYARGDSASYRRTNTNVDGFVSSSRNY
jgi:hypothetical protein